MENEFVPFELAVKLKELGFDKNCLAYFEGDKISFAFDDGSSASLVELKNSKYNTVAPLWQQAFDWFREKHLLHTVVEFSELREKDDDEIELYSFRINEQWSVGKSWLEYSYGFKHRDYQNGYKSYQEARTACLEKLIELTQRQTPQE